MLAIWVTAKHAVLRGGAGWDITKTISTLVRKSGWKGVLDDALRQSIALTRLQSTTCTLSYADYKALQQRTDSTFVDEC